MKIKPLIFESKTRYSDIADEIQDLNEMSLKEIKQKYSLNEINRGENKVIYYTFTPGKFLLKVSNNSREIEKEINVYECSGYSSLLTKIYGFDRDNYNWMITEQIQTLSKDKFEMLLSSILNNTNVLKELSITARTENSSLEREFVKILKDKETRNTKIDSKWLVSILELVDLCGLESGDLYHDNWGTRNGSDLVILDYGFEGFDDNEN